MQSLRHERVRELLKRELGEVIRREISIAEAGLINVNDVSLSGNLRSAIVFVGVFGNREQQKRGLDLLVKSRKRIQTLVGHSVILKYTPQIRFVLDESIERGNRVLSLLDQIERELPPQ